MPYEEVTREFAAIEGEGDKSLNYWRNAHWAYYGRECARIGRSPTKRMLVVCEQFAMIYRHQPFAAEFLDHRPVAGTPSTNPPESIQPGLTMDLTPPPLTVTRRIKRIAPLQLGKMMALTYGIMGLLFCPFFLLFSLFASQVPNAPRIGAMAIGTGFALMMPFFYAAMGFVFGVIGAFIYNLIAKWIGGIEVEVE